MQTNLIELIEELNPWLKQDKNISLQKNFIPRLQEKVLLLEDWDRLWTVLVGPRQAGKTSLGKSMAKNWLKQGRFKTLLYLNCDFFEIREFLKNALFLKELMQHFPLEGSILFVDEVQRLENPGLLLKGIADLKYPVKLLASGSSQLEMKSKFQEFLTGRHLECKVFPLSLEEIAYFNPSTLIFGCYPQIFLEEKKEILLRQLFNDYIQKDIIEILKVSKADLMNKLIQLLAHSSGQLVNYQNLANDCHCSVPTVQHYCNILEQSYTIYQIKPFVGNQRKEIVRNPIYYFLDNGFRNQALQNYRPLEQRLDLGLLVESFVFQELLKFQENHFLNYRIHYWRTQSGAEIDFVLKKNETEIFPIEVKYQNMKRSTISKSLHSFLKAYPVKHCAIITKNYQASVQLENTEVSFIPLEKLLTLFDLLKEKFL